MLLSTNCPVFKEISSTTTLKLLRNPTILNFQVKNTTAQVQSTNSTASTKSRCSPETFHCTSRKTMDHLFRQWYQLSRCCQFISCNLQNASMHFTDGNSTGFLGHWRMRMEIHSTTWTSLRRIIGSSSEIHEVSSAKKTRFSGCHLWGTVHITCWDRGLSKLQTLVCLIWWSFQPNLLVSWTFSNWWTPYPITCYWPYCCQMQ